MNKAEKFIGQISLLDSAPTTSSKPICLDFSSPMEMEEKEPFEYDIIDDSGPFVPLISVDSYESVLLTVPLLVNGNKAIALIDSGAGGNFISNEFVRLNDLHPSNSGSVRISMADGHVVNSSGRIKVELSDGNLYRDDLTLTVAPIRYDIILGKPWLYLSNPSINWRTNTINFGYLGDTILWETSTVLDNMNSLESLPDPCIISAKQVAKELEDPDTVEVFLLNVQSSLLDDRRVLNSILPADDDPSIATKTDCILQEYSDVFPDSLPDLFPPERHVDHSIDLLPDAVPHSQAPYRMSPLELLELRKQLQSLLLKGFISPSTSPWGAPVLFVKKKNGSMRFCVDYRMLNKRTVKNKYPLPHIEESLQRLYKAKYFTALDLHSAYHQVRIAEADRPKTAFNTRYGHYEFNVVPFGLTNAPATFQTLMNDLMRPFLDDFVIVYLDDILIFSDSLEDHESHVRQVLNVLQERNLIIL